ncbi:hypothetical protein BOX15_Mlig015155g1, partial [Macrostomum lignano]
ADLNHLFNWNVKQLFVYITAHYKTEKNAFNQVVLWDKIIRRGESARLQYSRVNPKYYFWDDGFGLRGNPNVTLALQYNVIPNSGRLLNIYAEGRHVVSMPENYIKGRA